MSKILCIGDLHLSHSRLELCSKVLKWIEEVIFQLNPDKIVYLGDVFDTHAVIRSECLCIWTNHLSSVLEYPVYWICGNHEFFKPNDSTYNALIPFAAWNNKNLNVITTPTQLDGLGFIPYLTKDKSWPQVTHGFTSKIIFTHNTFIGADFGFKRADEGIKLSDVTNELVISGHIHKRQLLENVTYPGTPYAWSAHDVDQKKGLMVLNSDTYEASFIESPFPTWQKVEIELSKKDNLVIPKTNDHIMIKLTGLRSDIKAFMTSEILEDFKKNNKSVSVSTVFLDSAKTESKGISIKNTSLSEAVESYMSKLYKGSAPADLVKKEVLRLLGEIK